MDCLNVEWISFLQNNICSMYIHIPAKWMISDLTFLFSSQSSMSVDKLEPEAQEAIRKKAGTAIKTVYFNKGLWWLSIILEYTNSINI